MTLAEVALQRATALLDLVRPEPLDVPSELPGWSRLTIVCHLRYGAEALARMTRDAVAGRETSYYPGGRATQRPGTLVPRPGEDVLASWADALAELARAWSSVEAWALAVVEPADNPDLGTVPLVQLPLIALTEVDVHATDLGIGAPDWSSELVAAALPVRLERLAARRGERDGSWLLRSPDGLRWLVVVEGGRVASRPASDDDTGSVIEGSRRGLLALLLGRPPLTPFGRTDSFELAFPGP